MNKTNENSKEQVIKIEFWGVRGTLPTSGEESLKYGGNTSCVAVTLPNSELFVFDAGSGIKKLSKSMLDAKDTRDINLFISHAHWDHINALPYLSQLYLPEYNINIFGPKNQNISVKQMISGQMQSIYFPITIDEFKAQITYVDLVEEQRTVNSCLIKTQLLNHPGNCLGYRLEYADCSICYITDNEIPFPDDPIFSQSAFDRLVSFIKKSDVLITDTTYLDEEYLQDKAGWGHSSVSRVVDLAHAAEIKHLYLFHHDPDQSDNDIDEKYRFAKQRLVDLNSKTMCKEAKEDHTVRIALKS